MEDRIGLEVNLEKFRTWETKKVSEKTGGN